MAFASVLSDVIQCLIKNVLVRSFFKILFPTFISNTPQNGSTLPSQFAYKS